MTSPRHQILAFLGKLFCIFSVGVWHSSSLQTREVIYLQTSSANVNDVECAIQCANSDACLGYVVSNATTSSLQCLPVVPPDTVSNICVSQNLVHTAGCHEKRERCVETVRQSLTKMFISYRNKDPIHRYVTAQDIVDDNIDDISSKAVKYPDFTSSVTAAYNMDGFNYLYAIEGRFAYLFALRSAIFNFSDQILNPNHRTKKRARL